MKREQQPMGEAWRVSQPGAIGDWEEVKVKRVRFAAGTKGRSDRKEWIKKMKMESTERAEAGDAAGVRGCGRNCMIGHEAWTWNSRGSLGNGMSELGAWKSAGYLSAKSGAWDPHEVPPTGPRKQVVWR